MVRRLTVEFHQLSPYSLYLDTFGPLWFFAYPAGSVGGISTTGSGLSDPDSRGR